MKSTSHHLVMSALYKGRKVERPPAENPTSIVCHGLMDAVFADKIGADGYGKDAAEAVKLVRGIMSASSGN